MTSLLGCEGDWLTLPGRKILKSSSGGISVKMKFLRVVLLSLTRGLGQSSGHCVLIWWGGRWWWSQMSLM